MRHGEGILGKVLGALVLFAFSAEFIFFHKFAAFTMIRYESLPAMFIAQEG